MTTPQPGDGGAPEAAALLFRACAWCGRHAEEGLRACSICRRVRYCDADHQKLAWCACRQAVDDAGARSIN